MYRLTKNTKREYLYIQVCTRCHMQMFWQVRAHPAHACTCAKRYLHYRYIAKLGQWQRDYISILNICRCLRQYGYIFTGRKDNGINVCFLTHVQISFQAAHFGFYCSNMIKRKYIYADVTKQIRNPIVVRCANLK